MFRKYHNHKLQTNPWHREEEPHNNNETPGRQIKQSNQLSLPHRDDYFLFIAALLPKSIAKVMAERSVHLTTLFPGQA